MLARHPTRPPRIRGAGPEPPPSGLAAYATVLGLIALVFGGLAAGAASVLEFAYPLAALLAGALLYWKYPLQYLGFAWWMWMVNPEVRRLVEYQNGFDANNPISLAPYLVTALALFTLFRHLPKLQLYRYLPIGLVLLGISYGYVVGMISVGLAAATFDLLNWLLPVVLAFHLMVHWRSYPEHGRAVERIFTWGVLLLGIYGVWQYLSPPPWDVYWMENAPIDSIGNPEPFQVRVFSTLNSPGPFSVVMMAGLLLLLSRGSNLRWPALGVGLVSFLLSLVRSAWGGLVVAVLFMISQRSRLRSRLVIIMMAAVVLATPLLYIPPVAERIGERLGTVTNLENDTSFQARLDFYRDFAPQAFLNPLGSGMGATGVATKLNSSGGELGELGNFDGGVMEIAFILGWPGSVLYVGGLLCLVRRALKGSRGDLLVVAGRGVIVGILAQIVFDNFLIDVGGMVFWTFLGLTLAAETYWQEIDRDAAVSGSIETKATVAYDPVLRTKIAQEHQPERVSARKSGKDVKR